MIVGQKALVIEVRRPDRCQAQHVTGSIKIPLAQLGDSMPRLPEDRDHPILCVCDMGNISAIGMLYLKSLGYSQVKSLSGGIRGWVSAGLATEP